MNRWTELVRSDPCPGDPFHPTNTPIYQTATFELRSLEDPGPYDYTRSGNPTRSVLEAALARLEGARAALAFASGMAALSTLTSLLIPGDTILVGEDLYGGTHRLLHRIRVPHGIDLAHRDTSDLRSLEQAWPAGARLVLIETPSNPLLRITDLAALARIAHDRGALLAVDNTLMSPWLQRPLDHGADVVVHSATKFLSGHGDVTAGALILDDPDLAGRLDFLRNAEGNALAPFEAWLLLRGMKTLGLRIERQQATARVIARHLATRPGVARIYYPGLADHPGAGTHGCQARGPGSVLSFRTGSLATARGVLESVRLFTRAVSFGGVASSISLPSAMSHASVPAEQRIVPADLIRLSIGIEDPVDLIGDLDAALEACEHGSTPAPSTPMGNPPGETRCAILQETREAKRRPFDG